MSSSMREGTDANGGSTSTDRSATALAEEEECAVQPSAPLINILHRRLRDPSIVASFERRCHSNNHSADGLVLARPHWLLQTASGAAVQGEDNYEMNAQKSSLLGDGASSSAAPIGGQKIEKPHPAVAIDAVKVEPISTLSMINSIPKRNYIDLRIQQNEIFANHQYTKCLSNLKKIQHQQEQQSSKKQQLQQKVANDIQSLLNEGLAAFPNHEGLLSVQKEYRDWMIIEQNNGKRMNGSASSGAGRGPGGTPSCASSSLNANRTNLQLLSRVNNNNGSAILSNPQMLQQHPQHKGAEGRAQAAMRDALAERSFLLDDDGAAAAAKDIGAKYPLLSVAHGEIGADGMAEKGEKIDDPEYNSSSEDSDGRSRSRRQGKKSKHKHKSRTSKKRGKKHRRDYDRKRRKDDRHRRGSRSRSVDSSGSRRSRSISSRSTSSSSSVDSYYKRSSKRKKYNKKEHKRRKKKKSHHHERAEEGCPKEEDTESNVTNEKDSREA